MPRDLTAAQPAATLPQNNTLGLRGHFGSITDFELGIPPDLQQMVIAMGGTIQDGGLVRDDTDKKQYVFNVRFGHANPELDFTGNISEVKKRLRQYKQPVKTAIQSAVAADVSKTFPVLSKNPKKRLEQITQRRSLVAKQTETERRKALSIIRFATTGASIIPPYVHEDLQAESAACHADTEQNMRAKNMWAETGEIDIKGRVESYNPAISDEPLEPAIIPGTRFDGEKGFTLHLSDHMFDDSAMSNGENQEQLRQWFWNDINAVTNNRYKHAPSNRKQQQTIYLTPNELGHLSQHVHEALKTPEFETLLDNVDTEERTQKAIARIQSSLSDFQESPFLQNVVRASVDQRSVEEKIRSTMKATSALNAVVITSDTLKERYAFLHHSKRDNTPMPFVAKDLQILEGVYKHYLENGASDLHREAIAQDPEFYGLLGFSAEAANVLKSAYDTLDKKLPEHVEAQEGFDRLENIFRHSSSAEIRVSNDHLTEEQQMILSVMERSTGQGDGAAEHMGKRFVEDTIDFATDLYQMPFESVANFAMFSGMLWVTWQTYQIDSGASSISAEQELSGFADMFGDKEFDSSNLIYTDNSSTCLESVNDTAHLHSALGQLIQYKSVIGGLVCNTSMAEANSVQAVTELPARLAGLPIDPQSEAIQGAHDFIKSFTNWFVAINTQQGTGGHAPMYSSFTTMGFAYGLRAITRIGEFFDDSTDSMRAAKRENPLALYAGIAGFAGDRITPHIDGIQPTGAALTLAGLSGGYLIHRMADRIWKHKGKKTEEFLSNIEKSGADFLKHTTESKIEPQPVLSKDIIKAMGFDLPGDIRSAQIDMRFGGIYSKPGLPRTLDISEKNLGALLYTTQQFGLLVSQSGEAINADRELYQEFIMEQVSKVSDDLIKFQHGRINSSTLEKKYAP